MADLFNVAVAVVLAVLVIGGLWYAARPKCVFLLSLEGGRLRLIRGKVLPAFLEEAGSILAEAGVTGGEIRGHVRGRSVALSFSPSIPPDVQQRLRNVWLLHR